MSFYTTTGTTWAGYIGLMDPADFGFAVSGKNTSRSTCLGYYLYVWSNYSDCSDNSWIRYSNPTESMPQGSVADTLWTIRTSTTFNNIISVTNYIDTEIPNATYRVRPVLYLTTNAVMKEDSISDGSYEHPFLVR